MAVRSHVGNSRYYPYIHCLHARSVASAPVNREKGRLRPLSLLPTTETSTTSNKTNEIASFRGGGPCVQRHDDGLLHNNHRRGGFIGNSISCHLAKRGIPCTVIDPVGIAPAASGKAGGFLARNWSDGSPVQELQRRSFDFARRAGRAFLGSRAIDYGRIECVAVSCDELAAANEAERQKASRRRMGGHECNGKSDSWGYRYDRAGASEKVVRRHVEVFRECRVMDQFAVLNWKMARIWMRRCIGCTLRALD